MDLTFLLSGLAILVLLLCSALLSGSETALTTSSRPRMHQLERRGNRRAAHVNWLQGRQGRLLGAILIGNNLVNILASSLATGTLIALFGDAGVVYAAALMTVLIVLFGEILPKTYALHHADRAALLVAPPIRLLVRLLTPLLFLVHGAVQGALRLFGAGERAPEQSSEDELRSVLELHSAEGRIEKSARDMLHGLLDLSEVEVSEVMVHRRNMLALDADLPPVDLLAATLGSRFSRLPLFRDNPDNIVGVLRIRDLLRVAAERAGKLEGLDLLTLARPAWFVPETTTLREQLHAFRQRDEELALVVDEYGAIQGLITPEDILEEIVGSDTTAERRFRREADGSYLVAGTVTVRELNRACDWELPEDEAATVAGLLIAEAKRLPEVGERFNFHGFEFKVLKRQRNQLTSLRLRPAAGAPEQSSAA